MCHSWTTEGSAATASGRKEKPSAPVGEIYDPHDELVGADVASEAVDMARVLLGTGAGGRRPQKGTGRSDGDRQDDSSALETNGDRGGDASGQGGTGGDGRPWQGGIRGCQPSLVPSTNLYHEVGCRARVQRMSTKGREELRVKGGENGAFLRPSNQSHVAGVRITHSSRSGASERSSGTIPRRGSLKAAGVETQARRL